MQLPRSKEFEAFNELDAEVKFSPEGKFDIHITSIDHIDDHITPVPEVGLCVLKYKGQTTKYVAETVDEDSSKHALLSWDSYRRRRSGSNGHY